MNSAPFPNPKAVQSRPVAAFAGPTPPQTPPSGGASCRKRQRIAAEGTANSEVDEQRPIPESEGGTVAACGRVCRSDPSPSPSLGRGFVPQAAKNRCGWRRKPGLRRNSEADEQRRIPEAEGGTAAACGRVCRSDPSPNPSLGRGFVPQAAKKRCGWRRKFGSR